MIRLEKVRKEFDDLVAVNDLEVAIPEGLAVTGVVLADQVKNLDWQARQAEFADRLPDADADEVVGMVTALLSEGEA